MLGTQDSSSKYSDSQLFMVLFFCLYSNKNGHGETGIVSIVLVFFCMLLPQKLFHADVINMCVANTGPKGMFVSVCFCVKRELFNCLFFSFCLLF